MCLVLLLMPLMLLLTVCSMLDAGRCAGLSWLATLAGGGPLPTYIHTHDTYAGKYTCNPKTIDEGDEQQPISGLVLGSRH